MHTLLVRCVCAVIAVAFLTSIVRADELKRRARMGIRVAPVTAGEGVLAAEVFPGFAGEQIGLRAGDAILTFNGARVADVQQFLGLLRNLYDGDAVEIVALREGSRQTLKGTLRAADETSPDFDVLYRSVEVDGARRRVIVTKPKAPGRSPAVLLIGGIGCYSTDNAFDPNDAYRRILYHLTRNGFVTMRVEKSSMGDSEGPPCPEVDFETEVKGYVAGLTALKQYDFVDASNVFIFGHSIGGISGPIVANRAGGVKGIIAAETVGVNWYEYELENLRRQLLLGGADHDAVEDTIRIKRDCMDRMFFEGKATEEVVKEAPQCAPHVQYPAHHTYLRQIVATNLPREWRNVDARVLVVYGGADFVTSAREHQYIAEVVNRYHPGRATFVQIPDMDHGFERHATQAEALRAAQTPGAAGEFHERFNQEILQWLRSSVGPEARG
jgi:pimeloyl-ACP methyl ester carboxylesterase